MSDRSPGDEHRERSGLTDLGDTGLGAARVADLLERPIVERSFFARDARIVAPELLHKILLRRSDDGVVTAVRIVETEAYLGSDDPAAHSFRGETRRNRSMFGPPGHLYVYFTYGMHWCANTVCGDVGEGTGVLMRAGSPLVGIDEMFRRRPKAHRERDLCSGPAKLCQALGITGNDDGTDLAPAGGSPGPGVVVLDDGTPPPADPVATPRVGVSHGTEHRWRWYVADDPHVSRP